MKEISTVKIPAPTIEDDGRARLGLTTPLFPPVRTAPEKVIDNGKVRTGYVSPAFPPPRAR